MLPAATRATMAVGILVLSISVASCGGGWFGLSILRPDQAAEQAP